MDSTLLGVIAPYAGTLIAGGFLGVITGYFIKKAVRVIALIAGAIMTVFILAAYKHMIVVDWASIQHQSNDIAQQGLHTMTNALTAASHDMTAAGINHIDIAYPLFGVGAFLPGFVLGFWKG